MAFLHGTCKQIICSSAGLYRNTTYGNIRYSYKHEPAAKAVVVVVRLNDGTDATASLTCQVGINAVTTVLGGTSTVLDGSSTLYAPTSRSRVPQAYVKYLDPSGLTVGTVYDLLIAPSTVAGSPRGVYSVSAYVIPRDVFDAENNPSTDQGSAFYFPRGWNPIYAGSDTDAADTGGGLERYVYEMDRRRKYAITYPLNLARNEIDADAYSTTSAVFATLTNLSTASFRCRATRLYTTATVGTYQARVRYKSAGGDGVLRIITTPVGGSSTNNDVPLATAAGYGWTTAAVTIDTSGTNQEADITIQAKVAAGTLYIDSLAVYSNES